MDDNKSTGGRDKQASSERDTSNKSNKGSTAKSAQRRGRKKSGSRIRQRQDQRRSDNADDSPERNDWTFYAINEQIAKDLGNFPYNKMSGVGAAFRADMRPPAAAPFSTYERDVYAGAILALGIVDTPGYAAQKTDGINMAATQLYTSIRRANSGARNYEAADVMMYILAMRDVYCEIIECKRAIALVQTFAYENRYLPDSILTALNVDPVDLRANIAQYRGQLNVLISKVNALAVPKYFKAFQRGAYIHGNVFLDSSSIRGQFYGFYKTGTYLWTPVTSETGSSLTYTTYGFVNTNPVKMSARLSRITQCIDALFLDTDINTMSGDILKAFGGGDNLFLLGYITDMDVLAPLYDEDILAQIENCVSYGSIGQLNALNIEQSNQLISFKPYYDSITASIPILRSRYFNSHKDEPDYKDNLEWSRLSATLAPGLPAGNVTNTMQLPLRGFGLEYVVQMVSWRTRLTSAGKEYSGLQVYNSYSASVSLSSSKAMIEMMQFDWHPQIVIVDGTQDTVVGMDIKKYTILDDAVLTPLHDSAVAASFWSDEVYTLKA